MSHNQNICDDRKSTGVCRVQHAPSNGAQTGHVRSHLHFIPLSEPFPLEMLAPKGAIPIPTKLVIPRGREFLLDETEYGTAFCYVHICTESFSC